MYGIGSTRQEFGKFEIIAGLTPSSYFQGQQI